MSSCRLTDTRPPFGFPLMLGRLLQVRRGESTRAVLLFTYLFLVIASSVITKANRDALFQEKFGSFWLPYVDMASAAIVAAVMSIYLRVSRRVSPQSLQIGTLVVGAAATVEFWFIARVREPVWMLPVLYVWVGAAGRAAAGTSVDARESGHDDARGEAAVRRRQRRCHQRRDRRADSSRERSPTGAVRRTCCCRPPLRWRSAPCLSPQSGANENVWPRRAGSPRRPVDQRARWHQRELRAHLAIASPAGGRDTRRACRRW